MLSLHNECELVQTYPFSILGMIDNATKIFLSHIKVR